MITVDTTARKYRLISLFIASLGILTLLMADIEISATDPMDELLAILAGFISPDLSQIDYLAEALLTTVSFAVVGISIAATLGIFLAPLHHLPLISHFCAFIRSIHELFWALIFLQMFGLSSITGVLAIAIPYTGIFARVYSDILEQSPLDRRHWINDTSLSVWLYTCIIPCWAAIAQYTRYRFECALRSAAILGFIGLPTLGYYLETAFSQGQYNQAAGLLLLFFAMIATLKWWLNIRLVLVYLIAAIVYLPWQSQLEFKYLVRFITQDIVPQPLLEPTLNLSHLSQWFGDLVSGQILPGIGASLLLSVSALLCCGVIALLTWPLASRAILGRGYILGHGLLIVMRSTPEIILAFVIMLIIGPSMLPAILALALHNGAIIGYLLAHRADRVPLRVDRPNGLNLWAYELQPQIYPSFISLIFYRFEVILRESAILGMLGVTTLGFYIDSAFEALFFDVALILILVTAALNMLVNSISLRLRRYLALDRIVTA